MKKLLTLLFAAVMSTGIASAQGIPVLMYHEVVTAKDGSPPGDTVVLVNDFNAQMAWLYNNGYRALSMETLVHYMNTGKLPPCYKPPIHINSPKPYNHCTPIIITFDDGWYNQLNALPALNKYGFTATFNIIAGFPGNDASYMGWPDIVKLSGKGQEIGGHTMTHTYPLALADAPVELLQSKQRIESHINKTVQTLAWPNGYFTVDLIDYTENVAHYIGTSTVNDNWCTSIDPVTGACLQGDWHTGNLPGDDPFLIKRIFIDGRCTIKEFATIVTQEHASPCAAASAPAVVRLPQTPAHLSDNNTDVTHASKHNRDQVDPNNDGEDHRPGKK